MGRKTKSRRKYTEKKTVTRQREYPQYRRAERLLPVPSRLIKKSTPLAPKTPNQKKALLHDRRMYRPESYLERYGRYDERRRLVLRDRKKDGRPRQTKARLGFADYKRDEVCIRRSRRRESLFARGKAGKGIRITSPKNYNIFSKVRCK